MGLIVGSLGAAQARKPARTERVVRGEYIASLSTTGIGVTWQSPAGSVSEVPFTLEAGEKYVSVEIVDDSGHPTAGCIQFDTDGDGSSENIYEFCGATEKPVTVNAGEIEVRVATGVCGPDNQPVIATSGEVIATFSNRVP